ncbi:endo alpha-1,4 polygalactosaminidase, partial [bacterium]|nr:endo alpha-1,4 polygalactosaminidase [bacterium]
MKRSLFLLFFLLIPTQFSLPFLIYYGHQIPDYELYKYDDLVIDPDQYHNVWDFPNRSYAYISMGEIEKFRSYYRLMDKKKVLTEVNPDWPDARYVSLKNGIWKDYLLNKVIPSILEKGYKGIFLDTLDSLLVSKQNRKLILDLINSIKKRFPKLKLMANRGLSLLKDIDVDSVLLESTLSHYDFNSKHHSIADEPEFKIPKRIQIFSLDYWPRKDQKTIRKLYKRAVSKGYIPLISTIDLQKEPILLYDPNSKLFFNSEKKQFEKKGVIRKILGISSLDDYDRSAIHLFLESTLNYYGMHCLSRDFDHLPDDPTLYDGIILWLRADDLKDPLKLFQFLA